MMPFKRARHSKPPGNDNGDVRRVFPLVTTTRRGRKANIDPYAQVATMRRWSVADGVDPSMAQCRQGGRVRIWT
ncbi:hypothetical protein BN2476_240043 [Paraburkholderia piptadeniae]|uniref:Uncharacterized protein n=1 Tax=Paraburkholderia piptadeniae TaxID=1701573 RepID=A0A1N7RZR2_9BURK|nr:hypothetical protein BN2476_240043 [Paraburkholderia piptadeniae]